MNRGYETVAVATNLSPKGKRLVAKAAMEYGCSMSAVLRVAIQRLLEQDPEFGAVRSNPWFLPQNAFTDRYPDATRRNGTPSWGPAVQNALAYPEE